MMAAPEYYSHLGPVLSGVLFWGGIAVFLLTIIVMVVLSLHEERKRKAVLGPIIIMAIGTLIFCGGAAWYFWPSEQRLVSDEKKQEVEIGSVDNRTLNELLLWDGLTAKEFEVALSVLKNSKRGSVRIMCRNNLCARLSEDLFRLFQEAKWAVASQPPLPPHSINSATGIYSMQNNSPARSIKEAFSKTRFNVELPPQRSDENNVVLAILSRPLPNSLPSKALKQVQNVSTKLKDLSGDILQFAGNRERELAAQLLAVRNPSTRREEEFVIRRDFSNETDILFIQRFSERVTPLLAELEMLGIGTPFIVSANHGRPSILAKYFSVAGRLLEQGRVDEARTNALDQNFWWSQQQ